MATRLSPVFRPPRAKAAAPSSSRSVVRGKGKKRLRDCENRSVSQFSGDSAKASTTPDPLAPKEKVTAAAAPHGKCEGDYGKPLMNDDLGRASGSSCSKSRGANQEGKEIGWAWPVERLRREGFTHVVCAPSNASRTALWDELAMLGSERAPEKTSRPSEGGWVVEVVGVDWLVNCLGEKVSAVAVRRIVSC